MRWAGDINTDGKEIWRGGV